MTDSRHLLLVSLGPVQGFISAARRTRDFWMGSAILSECAKGVARELAHAGLGNPAGLQCKQLVFPAVDAANIDIELKPLDLEHGELNSTFDVANIVMGVVEGTEGQLRQLVGNLEDASQQAWRQLATKAGSRHEKWLRTDWKHQIDDQLIEFYSVWVPFPDDSQYGSVREAALRLLGGRKACRDFKWWEGKHGIPKSSLDGDRESVLRELGRDEKRQGLRIKPKEQLDLIGLTKRVDWGYDSIRFPSVSRIAIAPFIAGVMRVSETDADAKESFEAVQKICHSLPLRKRRTDSARDQPQMEIDLSKFPWLKSFRFEGTPLYVTRHQEIVSEFVREFETVDNQNHEFDSQMIESDLKKLREMVAKLCKATEIATPWEYVAFLKADGDGMGRTLSEISKLKDGLNHHRQFSRKQSEFATWARGFINKECVGACFFAGADDVLGMVAVPDALRCAETLREHFNQTVGKFVESLKIPPPTLSIGISIGHFLEPLEDLLEFVNEAEYRAKNPTPEEKDRGQTSRSGLAIAYHSRGGAPIIVRDNWIAITANEQNSVPTKLPLSLLDRIKSWIDLARSKSISTKAAYDLREVARRYQSPWVQEAEFSHALRSDAQRVLGRKLTSNGSSSSRNEIEQLIICVNTAEQLEAIARELIIGQRIGEAIDQADGKINKTALMLETTR